MAGFAVRGEQLPRLWEGRGEWGPGGLLSTLGHSGLFDVSPRLDPRSRQFDVVHFASNLGALRPGPNSVVTVHDLMHRRWNPRRYGLRGTILERGLLRAGRVVAISDRTRVDLERIQPALTGRIEVIPHGMRIRAATKGDREYVLAFGGAGHPRKRIDFMVAVYEAYRRTTPSALPLVVLARAGLTDSQRHSLTSLEARIMPTASATEVDALMQGAAALIYPTAEEGFGLPILEAAEVGTPVVMDAKALVATEVLGNHCFRASSLAVSEWVAQLRYAIASAPIEHPLDLPDWSVVAGRYRSLYAEVK